MPETVITERPVGRTDLTVSSIGLGCVTFGREIDQETAYQVLDYAMERGITFYDSAEGYGGGNSKAGRNRLYGVDDVREVTTEMYSSEKILGRWMKERNCRDRLVLCTKVSSGNSPENIRQQLARSLEHLGVDCVDVYELHQPDPKVPLAESLDVLNQEVQAGTIKVIGCSNFSAEQIGEALEVSAAKRYVRFEITQPPYSLVDRRAEPALLPLCRQEQIAVTSYSPLAAGFLAGKYTPDRTKFPKGTRFDIMPGHADVYFSDHNFRVVERLRELAAERGIPMVRLAMAWAMTHPDVTTVLIGARKTEHVDNALRAADMQLDPQLRQRMSAWE